jgi:hypothetical protein
MTLSIFYPPRLIRFVAALYFTSSFTIEKIFELKLCELSGQSCVVTISYNLANSMKSLTLYRWLCSGMIAVLVALGLGSKAYSGWAEAWVNGYSGDLFYQMFWIWLVGAWWVRGSVPMMALVTFMASALIECSQLIEFPAAWQAQFWWRWLLGSHFSWADFVHYAVGSALGAVSLSWLRKRLSIAYADKNSAQRMVGGG